MPTVTAEIFVKTSAKVAYLAFTNSTSLREWLCDVATVEPHVNGRMYLWWRGDFYSSGHYLELDENKRIRFRWFASIDSAPTEVTVSVIEKDGGTLVHLDHAVPDDLSWTESAKAFRDNWVESLENLKSVLETGIDLRIATRPMLGIVPGDFTEEQATALGIPVRDGLRLDGLVESMGAYRSGLRKDDVLVEMNGHLVRADANSLPNAIAGKKGGDKIEVVFYRGPEKKTLAMELSKRPMPEVPFDPAELEKRARELYETGLAPRAAGVERTGNHRAFDPWGTIQPDLSHRTNRRLRTCYRRLRNERSRAGAGNCESQSLCRVDVDRPPPRSRRDTRHDLLHPR